MADDKKPSEVLGGWNRQVAEQLGQIADNTGGEGTAQAGSEKRPSDVLGGWYKEVSDLLDDIATNTEGGGEYELPTMSPTTKGGATVGDGLTMDGTALSVDYSEVASVDALEEATALSPTGGIVSTQDGLAVSPTQQTDGAIDGALLELTAKSKPATQQTTTGKNLLDDSKSMSNADYKVFGGTLSSNDPDGTFILDAGTYTVSSTITVQVISVRLSASETILSVTNTAIGSFTLSERAAIKIAFGKRSSSTNNWSDFGLQLELGSTATPYEPYTGGAPSPSPDYPQPIVTVTGHEVTGKEGRFVSLERRDSQGTLLDTTPIPLPSRGWVAGLPDGTADELSVDGAGKVVWTENTTIATKSDTSKYSDWDTPAGYTVSFAPPNQAIESAEIMCNKLINDDPWYTARCISIDRAGRIRVSFETSDGFAAAIPFDYLYPLATPVTEDCGYIDLPDTQDCVLSIPELDALGVRYTIGDGAEIARQWYQRAHSEYEQRIADLEEAVAELTAGA